MIAFSRGSERLAGAASLKSRIPAVGAPSTTRHSSLGRATGRKPVGCGFESRCLTVTPWRHGFSTKNVNQLRAR
jgi:hypothetical protein